jgi:hypothetical protein
MQLGRAAVEVLAASLGPCGTSLHLSGGGGGGRVLSSFWRPLAQHFPNLGQLHLERILQDSFKLERVGWSQRACGAYNVYLRVEPQINDDDEVGEEEGEGEQGAGAMEEEGLEQQEQAEEDGFEKEFEDQEEEEEEEGEEGEGHWVEF